MLSPREDAWVGCSHCTAPQGVTQAAGAPRLAFGGRRCSHFAHPLGFEFELVGDQLPPPADWPTLYLQVTAASFLFELDLSVQLSPPYITHLLDSPGAHQQIITQSGGQAAASTDGMYHCNRCVAGAAWGGTRQKGMAGWAWSRAMEASTLLPRGGPHAPASRCPAACGVPAGAAVGCPLVVWGLVVR